MKKYLLFVLCFVSLTLLVPDWVHAEDPTIIELNKIIKNKVDEINIWNSLAQMLAFLTLTVAILGAISGIMSQFTTKWAKIIIAVAGGCIAIITVVINIRYPVDYRTYKKLTYDAQMIVDDINIQISQLPAIADMNKRKEIIDTNIWPKLQKITDIGKQLIHARNDGLTFGISEAFAQQMVPPWVTNPPKEKNTLYFVGHGVANDPNKALSIAMDYTKENARIAILDALVDSGQSNENPSNSRIVQSILEGSEVVNKFVKYAPQQKTYRYFCLLKIDIETIKFRLQLLAAGENIIIPPNFIKLLGEMNTP